MAIDKSVPLSSGVTTQYHRVTALRMDYRPDPSVAGQVGVAHVSVGSYLSKEARDAGMKPVATQNVQIRFGSQVSDTPVLRTPLPGRVVPETEIEEGTGRVLIKAVNFQAPEPIKLAVIRTDEPTRAEIYAQLMSLPMFIDGDLI